ncbi:MAG TPA: hypothetical protein VKA27_06040, partial [Sunxiuqinia sp.]|nr:hypothetical protein [Sunxiuqinia sp.]
MKAKRLPRTKKLFGFLILTISFMMLCLIGMAQTVTTDKLDYAPGEVVWISGSGWQPGEQVSLLIMNLTYDDLNLLPHYAEWFVTADASGDFTSSWDVT